ncbi:MAG: arylsulfatase, partial [Gammaproteobacteria bacterium]
HHPVQPEPANKGKTGKGNWADVLAQTDAYVGRLLDTVDELGIKDNTIFIFSADNGPEGVQPHQGFAGHWRGSYFTGLEGSLRVPFLIRWPGKIPAKSISNDIVHEMDLFTTVATFSGGKVPTDRIIDGVDQSDFFMGKQEKSDRESVVVYVGNDIFGVKWRDWKLMFKEVNSIVADPLRTYGLPLVYNLLLDPKEEYPAQYAAENLWIRFPAGQVLVDHAESLKKEPPIPPGTLDPYHPNK